MSDLKGTINYLKAVRDYCRVAGMCERCELYSNEVCPYQNVPDSWSDDHILKMINITAAYTELIKGMEEGE